MSTRAEKLQQHHWLVDVGHPHFVTDKPFEAGKGIAHMVFVSHFLKDGSWDVCLWFSPFRAFST